MTSYAQNKVLRTLDELNLGLTRQKIMCQHLESWARQLLRDLNHKKGKGAVMTPQEKLEEFRTQLAQLEQQGKMDSMEYVMLRSEFKALGQKVAGKRTKDRK